MTKQIARISLLLLVVLISSLPSFAQENWELKKDKNEIKVWVLEDTAYHFKPYRAMTQVKGSIQQFERLLKDIENMGDWAESVKNAKILEESDSVQIFYSEGKAPFPFKNRDGIYQNSFRWSEDAKVLKVDVKILPDYLELDEDLVRVKGHGIWIVKDLGDGMIEIFTEMHIDPGGNIPAWLANSFADENPYQSMMNMRELMLKD